MKQELFDERQVQKRSRIGSQSFAILVFLLMIDVLAYNFGIRWIEYPTNVFIIVLICLAVFSVRTALENALVAPKQKAGRPIALLLIAAAVSMATVFLLKEGIEPVQLIDNESATSAVLLMIISWGALITVAIIYFIKRRQDKRNEE